MNMSAMPSGPRPLQVRVEDDVLHMELWRAERGNALNDDLVSALKDALRLTRGAQPVRLVMLSAAGKHFSTGFDLSDFDAVTHSQLLHRFVEVELMLAAFWALPVPVVAYAQGRTWGAGADLFCTAQQRWAHPDASFRFPGAQFGLVLGTRRLAERIGADRARRWIGQGLEAGAQEAMEAGLVTHIGTMQEFKESAGAMRGVLDAPTREAIYGASRDQAHLDEDLARLVRSAAAPDLKARIAAYRGAAVRRT